MKTSTLRLIVTAIACTIYLQTNAQVSSRLMGEADSTRFYDTLYYNYSAGRGGDLSHPMKFDSSFSLLPFGVDTQIVAVWQRFDAKDNIITAIERATEPGCGISGFIDISKDSNAYDMYNNKLAAYVFQGDTIPNDWTPHDSTFYTYDAKNNLLISLKPGVERDSFSYDASNNLLAQFKSYWSSATNMWVNGEAYTYSYFGGLLRSSKYYIWIVTYGAYISGAATYYYYNSTNDLIRKVQMQTDPYGTSPGALVYQQIDSNIFDASDNMTYAYHAQYDALFKTWQYSRDSNMYDAAHNVVADAQQAYDTVSKRYLMTTQLSYAYNTFHQMTYTHSLSFVHATGGDYTKRYYYELYTPTSVAALNAATADVNIFPNPANSEMTLRIQWNKPQAFTLKICDIQGRVMRQWSEQRTDRYQKQIPVADLPAGNYIISIKGEHGQLQRQLSIVH